MRPGKGVTDWGRALLGFMRPGELILHRLEGFMAPGERVLDRLHTLVPAVEGL
jgi:hypothetical protein